MVLERGNERGNMKKFWKRLGYIALVIIGIVLLLGGQVPGPIRLIGVILLPIVYVIGRLWDYYNPETKHCRVQSEGSALD